MTYAVGVCVLDNPFFIDSVYDYRVPADMAADIVKGGFVTVPFGNSNTLRMALVTELREEPPQRELKAVHEICPPTLALDEEMQAFTAQEGMPYLRDNDQYRSDFGRPPVVVNYFYHEEVRKSAKK